MRSEAVGGRGGFPLSRPWGLVACGQCSQPPRGCDFSEYFPLLPVEFVWTACVFYKPSLGKGLVFVVSLSSICKVSNNRKSLSLPLSRTDQHKRLRQSGE